MRTGIKTGFKFIKIQLPLLLFAAFITNCNKPLNVKWVNYKETICADKWTRTANNEKLKENITTYCKSKGIRILELEIFTDEQPENCAACECKTGRRIRCKIKKSDLSDAKKEGFYE